MDNPETLTTLGIQDTGRRQTQKQNTTHKTKKMSNRVPHQKLGLNPCACEGKQFLLLIRHPQCYSYSQVW